MTMKQKVLGTDLLQDLKHRSVSSGLKRIATGMGGAMLAPHHVQILTEIVYKKLL